MLQTVLVFKRSWFSIWRNPIAVVLDLLRSLIVGVIFGTVFWFRPMDQPGVNEQFSVIFFSAIFANLSGVRKSYPFFCFFFFS